MHKVHVTDSGGNCWVILTEAVSEYIPARAPFLWECYRLSSGHLAPWVTFTAPQCNANDYKMENLRSGIMRVLPQLPTLLGVYIVVRIWYCNAVKYVADCRWVWLLYWTLLNIHIPAYMLYPTLTCITWTITTMYLIRMKATLSEPGFILN